MLGTARTGMFYIGLFALKMKHLVEVWEVLCLVDVPGPPMPSQMQDDQLSLSRGK